MKGEGTKYTEIRGRPPAVPCLSRRCLGLKTIIPGTIQYRHSTIRVTAVLWLRGPDVPVTVTTYVTGVLPPVLPRPPVLTPPHERSDKVRRRIITNETNPLSLRFLGIRPVEPQPTIIPGKNRHSAKKIARSLDRHRKSADAAGVEIVITTFTAEFPGVCGAEGLGEHCAPAEARWDKKESLLQRTRSLADSAQW